MTNFDREIQQIQKLRETKGSEAETLSKINEIWPEIERENDFATLAKLYWEKAFVYQHLVMGHTDTEDNLKLMEQSALSAHDLVTKNNLSELQGDDLRFLGRIYDYKQDFKTAFDYYQQALNFYQSQDAPRILEINAFMSANLINQGKTNDGLNLAKKIYGEFENSPLKNSDFYTWAVWKTGIYPRMVQALVSKKVEFDHTEIKNYLENDQKLLLENEGNFQFRLDEISEALRLLKSFL